MAVNKTPKKVKCYYCGGVIESENDLVVKPIPLHTKAGIKNYKRKFHKNCVSDFTDKLEVEKETLEENSEWEKCYEYAKDLMGIGDGQNLDQHFTLRLLGTRVGKYVPSSTNTRGLKRGYSFEVILTTMKFCSYTIKNAFGTMQFKDQKHKIDYAMKIITSNLNFVYEKMDNKKKAESKLENIKNITIDNERLPVYNRKSNTSNTAKIKEVISSVSTNKDEDDEMDSLMNLFE